MAYDKILSDQVACNSEKSLWILASANSGTHASAVPPLGMSWAEAEPPGHFSVPWLGARTQPH